LAPKITTAAGGAERSKRSGSSRTGGTAMRQS
jgi:hypothetical protein